MLYREIIAVCSEIYTKLNLKIQSVPRSKYTSSRLYDQPVSAV
jgi:hypothetical protein